MVWCAGKHGVYLNLLDDVRKSFETQDLVRVNCQGFHSKNLKLLGSQLQVSFSPANLSWAMGFLVIYSKKIVTHVSVP